jgi:hypothetical protein
VYIHSSQNIVKTFLEQELLRVCRQLCNLENEKCTASRDHDHKLSKLKRVNRHCLNYPTYLRAHYSQALQPLSRIGREGGNLFALECIGVRLGASSSVTSSIVGFCDLLVLVGEGG